MKKIFLLLLLISMNAQILSMDAQRLQLAWEFSQSDIYILGAMKKLILSLSKQLGEKEYVEKLIKIDAGAKGLNFLAEKHKFYTQFLTELCQKAGTAKNKKPGDVLYDIIVASTPPDEAVKTIYYLETVIRISIITLSQKLDCHSEYIPKIRELEHTQDYGTYYQYLSELCGLMASKKGKSVGEVLFDEIVSHFAFVRTQPLPES